jgi:BASS family bile acid:Na+ symporter
MAPDLLKLLLEVIIFILMLSLGVSQSLRELGAFWRRQGSLLRSLLSVIVIFPVVVFLLLKLVNVPAGVASGLAILAAAPGAPVTYKRSALAGGNPAYTTSLHLTLAILTILVTPFILYLFYGQFDLDMERGITLLEVAEQVAAVQFLPIGIGLLLQRIAPNFVEAIRQPLSRIAHLAFLLLVGIFLFPLILWSILQLVWPIGLRAIALMAAVVVITLVSGYLLGGTTRLRPEQALVGSERAALAIATIARNLGLALLIADLSEAAPSIMPTILGYALVSMVVAVPFSIWSKRQLSRATDTAA